LREVHRRHDADAQHYFFCDQYSNEETGAPTTRRRLSRSSSKPEAGSPISLPVSGREYGDGLGRRLKEHDPAIRLVCVLPEVFPGSKAQALGPQDIVPAILDETVIDERIPVTSEDAYTMCVRLARAGFFVGHPPVPTWWASNVSPVASERDAS